jgi:hypothetical protein
MTARLKPKVTQPDLPKDLYFEVAKGTTDFWPDFSTEPFKPQSGWFVAHYVLAPKRRGKR